MSILEMWFFLTSAAFAGGVLTVGAIALTIKIYDWRR
jgi:hypothetical protein